MAGNTYERSAQEKQRHAEARARTDSQHERPCQRIAEKGLHQQAAGRKRAPRQHGDHSFDQPDFKNDITSHRIARPARQQRPHLAAAHTDRSRREIAHKEYDDGDREQAEKNSPADFEGGVHFL